MTEEQMKLYLENQKVICEQSEKACRAIQKQTAEQSAEYTDHYINGVTYRVWSAFEGKTNAADSLSGLMLRKLESGEQVGEVVDEFKEGIKRVSNCSLVTM